MNVYYLADNVNKELSRLENDIDTSIICLDINTRSETELKEAILTYKNRLAHSLLGKKKEVKNVFSYGKPFFTYLLVVFNLIMFVLIEIKGGSTDLENLITFGAKFNPAIVAGEWWRIISSMFIHIGYLHLLMNMIALYYLGVIVEKIYGAWRFLLINF